MHEKNGKSLESCRVRDLGIILIRNIAGLLADACQGKEIVTEKDATPAIVLYKAEPLRHRRFFICRSYFNLPQQGSG